MSEILLSVRDLKMHYALKQGLISRSKGVVKAVDGLSFELARGETLALVGESDCGKSTTGRAVMRLIEPTAGQVLFEGQDVRAMSGSRLFQLRQEMQIVFQDAYSFLNPRVTIGQAILEPMEVHGLLDKQRREQKAEELLEIVGLDASYAKRYPHECSGGPRQRIGIARALSLTPKLIVADEPVSALDVSVQSQEYVRTVRAKGLPQRIIFVKHVMRPALDTILTVLPKMVAFGLSGMIIVERLFNIRGVTWFFGGRAAPDMAVLLSTMLILLAAFVIVINILTGVVRLWVNPALRR